MCCFPESFEIIFDKISFDYGTPENFALENISFELESGIITSLVGSNGAGKSTLIKLLLGLVDPLEGEIFLRGKSSEMISLNSAIRSQIFYPIFQNPENQIVATTVFDDVAFVPENRAMDPSKIRSLVLDSINRAGLSGFENDNPQMLSGGQKQRLAIAGALAANSRFLILDEPSAMLDPVARLEMFNFLKELTQSGMGILLVSHLVDEIRFSEGIHCLDSGRIRYFEGFNQFAISDKFHDLGWNLGLRNTLERLGNDF